MLKLILLGLALLTHLRGMTPSLLMINGINGLILLNGALMVFFLNNLINGFSHINVGVFSALPL